MKRNDFVLASMSTAGRQAFTPVQVQKFFFLLDQNASSSIGGPYFSFSAYDYGPFDKEVYHALESLEKVELIEILGSSWNRTRLYRVTENSLRDGSTYLEKFPEDVRKYTQSLGKWVLSLSFSQLVSSIYKEYPAMRANSVFQD